MASFPRADVDELIHEIRQKIEHWNLVGHAEEYDDLDLREAYLQQVSDADRNRFGGGMGPYAAHLVAVPGVEYINASPIDHLGGEAEHRYIATMCPKANTTADFWAMVWHSRARVVVNLTHARDRLGSSPLDKRERYWPPFSAAACAPQTEPAGGGRRVAWPVRVQTLAAEVAADADATIVRYTVRLVERASSATRDVRLYWCAHKAHTHRTHTHTHRESLSP